MNGISEIVAWSLVNPWLQRAIFFSASASARGRLSDHHSSHHVRLYLPWRHRLYLRRGYCQRLTQPAWQVGLVYPLVQCSTMHFYGALSNFSWILQMYPPAPGRHVISLDYNTYAAWMHKGRTSPTLVPANEAISNPVSETRLSFLLWHIACSFCCCSTSFVGWPGWYLY